MASIEKASIYLVLVFFPIAVLGASMLVASMLYSHIGIDASTAHRQYMASVELDSKTLCAYSELVVRCTTPPTVIDMFVSEKVFNTTSARISIWRECVKGVELLKKQTIHLPKPYTRKNEPLTLGSVGIRCGNGTKGLEEIVLEKNNRLEAVESTVVLATGIAGLAAASLLQRRSQAPRGKPGAIAS